MMSLAPSIRLPELMSGSVLITIVIPQIKTIKYSPTILGHMITLVVFGED